MQLKQRDGLLITMMSIAAIGYSYLPSQWGKAKNRLRKKTTDKVIYLTFDDGPNPVYTTKLLTLLKEYHIKASFFLVAQYASEYPLVVKRIKEEGHVIGFHSLSHKSAMIQTPHYTNMEFEKSIELMESLGISPKYYRAPWGHVNVATLYNVKKHGFKQVLWDVMVQDWQKDTTVDELQYKLLKNTKPGDVICLHDGRGADCAPERMIEALSKTIPIWLEQGYRFDGIDEIES